MKAKKLYRLIALLIVGATITACSSKDVVDSTIDNMTHSLIGYWNNTDIDIPDNNSAGVYSEIDVNWRDGGYSIGTITTFINIEHEAAGDLKISLISPAGTVATLMEYRGGTQHLNRIKFEDNATRSIADFDKNIHTYKPEVALSIFNGENTNGVWKLHIIDNQATHTGKVFAWQLKMGQE